MLARCVETGTLKHFLECKMVQTTLEKSLAVLQTLNKNLLCDQPPKNMHVNTHSSIIHINKIGK